MELRRKSEILPFDDLLSFSDRLATDRA